MIMCTLCQYCIEYYHYSVSEMLISGKWMCLKISSVPVCYNGCIMQIIRQWIGECLTSEGASIKYTVVGCVFVGDVCYYDEKERFFIVGRIKELIKYKGFQVANCSFLLAVFQLYIFNTFCLIIIFR